MLPFPAVNACTGLLMTCKFWLCSCAKYRLSRADEVGCKFVYCFKWSL